MPLAPQAQQAGAFASRATHHLRAEGDSHIHALAELAGRASSATEFHTVGDGVERLAVEDRMRPVTHLARRVALLGDSDAPAACERLIKLLEPLLVSVGSAARLTPPMLAIQEAISLINQRNPLGTVEAQKLRTLLCKDVIMKHKMMAHPDTMTELLPLHFRPNPTLAQEADIQAGLTLLPTMVLRLEVGEVTKPHVAAMLAKFAVQAHGPCGLAGMSAATDAEWRDYTADCIASAVDKHEVEINDFEPLKKALGALRAGRPAA